MRELPDPASNPELFDGLLTRRVLAFFIDTLLLSALAIPILLAVVVSGLVTFGLGWLTLPIAMPLALLGYYALTLGSAGRATVGMRIMDLVLTPARGAPLDGFAVLIHPIVFWVTIWISWPFTILIALFTPRRQLIHDLVTGTLMVRRSPMERHWRNVRLTTA